LITPEFLATKARLEELIHQSKPHDDEEEADTYPIVPLLTDVTDSVE
jgi:hypothetical protein